MLVHKTCIVLYFIHGPPVFGILAWLRQTVVHILVDPARLEVRDGLCQDGNTVLDADSVCFSRLVGG